MTKNALLIEWDSNSGIRAGNINPRDPNLRCLNHWQNMDVTPCLEIRLVTDDRDLSQYEGIAGVTVLKGNKAINDAVDLHLPPKLVISDQFLFEEHIKDKIKKGTLDLDKLKGDTLLDPDTLTDLKAKGIKGIITRKPDKL